MCGELLILGKLVIRHTQVRENDRTRKIGKLEVIITQAVNKAATGDHRAREFLFTKVPWLQKDLVEPKKPHLTPIEAFEKVKEILHGAL